MALNRLLRLSIFALTVLGGGAAGMLTALQGATMTDMQTGRVKLGAVHSLADTYAAPVAGQKVAGREVPVRDVQAAAPDGAVLAPIRESVAWRM